MEEFYLKYIKSNLHKPSALLCGIILGILIFTTIDNLFEKAILNINIRFLIYGLSLFLWFLYWLYYRHRLPRNKKNRVGIVVALYAETEVEKMRLKRDFIYKLRKDIKAEKFGDVVNIIEIKNHFSEKIVGVDDIRKLHKKVKGHFYLWGNVKKRQDEKEKYFLNLDGMVIHRPIGIKNPLFKDFISVLPKQISFFEAFELRGFEFSADIVYLAVRYITGVAAYISGDPKFAHDLHLGLKNKFNKFSPLPSNLRTIRDKIPFLLSDEELVIARFYYKKHDFNKLKKWLNEALKSNSNNYGAWLLKAIVDFLPELGNNPIVALESIKKAKKYAYGTHEWRYSQAFLNFWLERYPEALKDCDNLKQKTYSSEYITVDEIEAFNLGLLDNHKEKSQLYFWLGFINFIKKKNISMAYDFFIKFDQLANKKMDILKQRSSIYLKQIKSEMQLKE